jgi:hypothetical protein
VVDDSRLIHDFHRGGRVPAGLRAYLMQPHWLYVATFANGASKVGTASNLRKLNRLAEQGAVAARYVARADDGRVVRVLEDMVTREAGLPQQVRSAAKAASLTEPAPAVELDALNRRQAGDVRALVAAAAVDGFVVADEPWERPAQAEAICRADASRHAYPHELSAGSHGFAFESLSGSIALVRLQDAAQDAGRDAGKHPGGDSWPGEAEPDIVVNLGLLKARQVELGDFESEATVVQESLF